MKCPGCNGRKYIELDKIGLIIACCPECNGMGIIDDSICGTGQPDSNIGSPSTSQPKQHWERKAKKRAAKRAG